MDKDVHKLLYIKDYTDDKRTDYLLNDTFWLDVYWLLAAAENDQYNLALVI